MTTNGVVAGVPPAATQAQPQASNAWSAGLLPGVSMSQEFDNQAPMLLVSAREKDGKCLKGDTLVIDPRRGQRVAIRDLVTQLKADGRALTMNAASLLVETTPVNFFENGQKQLYRLRTQTGAAIEATENHPFMTQTGWRALKDLRLEEDRVMIVAEYPKEMLWRGGSRDENGLKVLAYLIADGSLKDAGSPIFTKKEAEVREDFIRAVEAMGDETTTYVNAQGVEHVRVRGKTVKHTNVLNMIRENGLDAARSAEKFIPEFIFGLSKKCLSLFLNRLFTCDGSVERSGKISYSSTSIHMVQQLRHLLLRFGIVGIIRDKFFEGELYGAEIVVSSRAAVLRFIDEIGFFGEKAVRAAKVRQELSVPSEGHGGDDTQLWRHGPYLFDRIKSIEATAIEPTYDIEIAESHNFVANDFVVHNSATTITSSVGWPAPELHPLVLAIDDSGPDACINLGYQPLRMRFRDEDYPGVPFVQRMKMALNTLEGRKVQLKQQHGVIIVDDASTLANRLHEDAKREPKNARNPDMRAPFFELTVWFKEIINRVVDLGLPSVWLSWLSEGFVEKTKDSQGRDQVRSEMGGADILGKKLRNFLAGRAHQMFILEKRKVGVNMKDFDTGWPADALGYSRVLHARPWNNINAGGRYDRLLPPVCPPNIAWILSQITGRGPYAQPRQPAPGALR